ncbi:hypothetical protein [Candidatus Blastococcus massiliensis]|uniref:hypothetical protein n=1 Tax=Candidatus Blastococcus massiliensis TaxID=1470358 RepID=UPI00058DF763|nr:hypothetical protein [Candidatus Blastococcus massiliensis]
MTPELDGSALWPDRYLMDGRLVVVSGPPRSERPPATGLLGRLARRWRGWELWQQVLLVFFGAPFLAAPFSSISEDLQGGIGVAGWALGGLAIWWSRRSTPAEPDQQKGRTPEQLLASWDTTEARVAGAASRAWLETVREPAWSSPFLASSRAAFDGWAEVHQITDLALRIRNARVALGARPSGPAADYWERQYQALENTARQLGRRADALIRYRDQTAQLSAELQHLTELERLERSATEIEGLAIETAYASGRGDGGLSGVADEIAGVRAAMTELLDLMTRTRAPLAEPPDQPGGLPR